MYLLLDVDAWWAAHAPFEKIYWVVTIIFTLLFLLQMGITLLGGEHDGSVGDADDAVSGDDGIGFQFFTLKNMLAFFTILGWTGLACINSGMGNLGTLVISVIAGLAMMVIMSLLFYYTSKLSHSGTMNLQNAVGQTGEVYLTIPGRRSGTGKVHIRIQGGIRELDALTDDLADLPSHSRIRVQQSLNDGLLLVTKS
ncbi:hypothetical protein MKQ68_18240 [Chitinophaga horti]|uniref:Serine protease n=1 Tax=Chitinophaga horti TaxID=2920382 RepID=A0ABY6IXB1_9BACT|nr:hypothetical protein [Chitinophaga horti]UYQ92029.1 hypothetical protein MKQ68_18240 [Chitinophaga horti]